LPYFSAYNLLWCICTAISNIIGIRQKVGKDSVSQDCLDGIGHHPFDVVSVQHVTVEMMESKLKFISFRRDIAIFPISMLITSTVLISWGNCQNRLGCLLLLHPSHKCWDVWFLDVYCAAEKVRLCLWVIFVLKLIV